MTSIEGAYFEQPTSVAFDLRAGSPDVGEAVDVSMELFKELGATIRDKDFFRDSLTTHFTPVAELGYDGRLYPELPVAVSFEHTVTTADNRRAKGVDTVYRYHKLWTPGTEAKSYTAEELNAGAPAEPKARLAVFNADETTGVDPVLHGLNMPYDDKYREGAPQTQLEALEATKEVFASRHPNAFARALGNRAAVTLVLMDRIRGVKTVNPKSAEFILNQGFMRIPDLGRREVDGRSRVGDVGSDDSRLRLDRGRGVADPADGVGVAVGLNELEAQAS